MGHWTYYCIECGNGTNKMLPFCSECHGRVAETDVWLRYMRRFRPDFYRNFQRIVRQLRGPQENDK